MNPTFRFSLVTIAATIIFYLIHYSLFLFGVDAGLTQKLLLETHLFIGMLTLIVLTILSLLLQKHFNFVGFAFLGSIVVKMMIVSFYFYVKMKVDDPPAEYIFILQFFVAYFAYLAVETVLVFQELSKKS
ncbi:MAG: hypothetical protein CL843_17530 [Crocinitomicaceae bacterium]|nr:hypothetical protein [Crocinitomicaceae bacterium]|tara:strand:+ start:168 stop:557 length:390 start_codon:yes stop_codon:yes gene_type:complete